MHSDTLHIVFCTEKSWFHKEKQVNYQQKVTEPKFQKLEVERI